MDDKNIKWYNIFDSEKYIYGIAYIKKGFKAYLHNHAEKEIYYILEGTGKLFIDNKIKKVYQFDKIHIKSNVYHAMTPISDYMVLLYYFPKGPFQKIKYNYLNSHL